MTPSASATAEFAQVQRASGAVQVQIAGETASTEWDAYLAGKPSPAPLSAFAWGRILESCYGAEPVRFVARAGGKVCGVLFAYIPKAAGSSRMLCSAPLVADDAMAARALLDAAGDHCRAEGIGRSMIALGDLDLEVPYEHWSKTTVLRELPATEDEAWKGLRKKTRYAIRRAKDAGIEVLQGLQHMPEFHGTYRARMSEKSIPLHSLAFFQAMATALSDQTSLYVATKDNRILAGMIFTSGGGVAAYRFNAAHDDALKLGANYVLMWEVMRDLIGRGIRRLDLGESSPGGGVYAFKTVQFDGVPHPTHYCDVTRAPNAADVFTGDVPVMHKVMNTVTPFLPAAWRAPWLLVQKRHGRLL